MASRILYRAANDDYIGDSASFSESRETSEAYLDNPGFGGRRLYSAEVDIDEAVLLDLVDADDPMAALLAAIGSEHDYGAIGVDELVPRLADRLADAGYEWVRVAESFPADTITWIYVGGACGGEPELIEE